MAGLVPIGVPPWLRGAIDADTMRQTAQTYREDPPPMPPDIVGNLRARGERRAFDELSTGGRDPDMAGLLASHFMGGERSSFPLGIGLMDFLGPLSLPYDIDETAGAIKRYRETNDPMHLIEAGLGVLFMLPEAIPALGAGAKMGRSLMQRLMREVPSGNP